MIDHDICCAEGDEAIGDNHYVLKPHYEGFDNWSGCAFACGPDIRCSARTAKGVRCPKDAVVILSLSDDDGFPGSARLCGGHFGVHRRGQTELRVYL